MAAYLDDAHYWKYKLTGRVWLPLGLVEDIHIQAKPLLKSSLETNAVCKRLNSFSDEQINSIIDIVLWVTMTIVSNMLQLFERNSDIKFVVDFQGKEMNIVEVSDGLDGDFLGEEGWIDRFGNYLDFVTENSRRKM